MDSYSKLSKIIQRIAKNFNFFEISQIVTGKNANKSKFKASGPLIRTDRTPGKQR